MVTDRPPPRHAIGREAGSRQALQWAGEEVPEALPAWLENNQARHPPCFDLLPAQHCAKFAVWPCVPILSRDHASSLSGLSARFFAL